MLRSEKVKITTKFTKENGNKNLDILVYEPKCSSKTTHTFHRQETRVTIEFSHSKGSELN